MYILKSHMVASFCVFFPSIFSNLLSLFLFFLDAQAYLSTTYSHPLVITFGFLSESLGPHKAFIRHFGGQRADMVADLEVDMVSTITKEVTTITKEVSTITKEVTTITKEVSTTTIIKEVSTTTIIKEVTTITKEVSTTTIFTNELLRQSFSSRSLPRLAHLPGFASLFLLYLLSGNRQGRTHRLTDLPRYRSNCTPLRSVQNWSCPFPRSTSRTRFRGSCRKCHRRHRSCIRLGIDQCCHRSGRGRSRDQCSMYCQYPLLDDHD